MSVGGRGQKADGGRGVVQAGSINNSVIFQLIDMAQEPADVDRAISGAADHLHRLLRHKGWKNASTPLAILSAISVLVCLSVGWLESVLLYSGAALSVYCGYRLNSRINVLDSEIAATRGLLTEFYKIKLQHQLAPK